MSFDQTTVAAYLEVITINLVLSGDNVVVIGMAAAGLAKALRQKAIIAGIAAAAVIRRRRGRPRRCAPILQIVVADVSMSLDNVLAVAGAAAHDMNALVFGLILSVVLMAVASTLVAALLARYRWIGWLGLAIIVYVAGNMTLDGVEQMRTVDFHALLSPVAS
ncbi:MULTISPECIES: membrane protein [unclassified Mesorhizobium]|uniref:TerC family protein n=1 Tax=unclassified Mesorhizobium TaxID=325217 RepID=UPI0003CDFF9C|nr:MULTISPECIES: membrane protein [unclassified Mesorhizobium]ESY26099.1 membrane protein [Mesorhizobium sp. LNJC395A00]WJI75276.1 TerC family protein [Mesorhizobium sp. C395A]